MKTPVSAFVLGVLTIAAPAGAADSFSGRAALSGESATLGHGFAVLAPALFSTDGHRVSVAFFTQALDGALLKTTTTDDVSSMDGKGLRVVLDLNFKKGATQATPETYNGCNIGFHGFKESPLNHGDNANGAKSCGLLELSGDLKPGGVVRFKLKDAKAGLPFSGRTPKPYSWDLSFVATLRAATPPAGAVAAAKSEIKGAAILAHACGKTTVRHMGLVHAGNIVEAVKLGTQPMQAAWKALPEEDRLMMSVMMNKMSLSEADYSAQIKANGLLVVDGPSATLTVKQEHKDDNGTSTSTLTQNFKIDGAACAVSR